MFQLVDSKVGVRAEFAQLSAAQAALAEWIGVQRKAGEPVVEQRDGQWSDSKVTIWICDGESHVIKLPEPAARAY